MLKRHHIRGIRQSVFSSLIIFVVGAGLFFVLRADVFSHASDIVTENYKAEYSPVYKLPTDEAPADSQSEDKMINKKPQNTYVIRAQGLPSFTVTSVIDGNTVMLDNKIRMRLIGIKAPQRDEVMGLEAYDFLKKMIEKKEVYFQRDDKSPKDPFGIMLGILYLDKKNVNIEILRAGFAHIYPTTPSIVGYADWQSFEDEAREAKRGLWSGEKSTSIEKEDKIAIPVL